MIKVDKSVLDQYPTVNLIRGINDTKVYFIQNGVKSWIQTAAQFEQKGYQWGNIDIVKDEEVAEYKEE